MKEATTTQHKPSSKAEDVVDSAFAAICMIFLERLRDCGKVHARVTLEVDLESVLPSGKVALTDAMRRVES